MERAPIQFLWRHYEQHLERARTALARFLGARRQDLVFATNATAAVNAVVRSLPLRPGDEVLTTSHNYNACHNVLREACLKARARLIVARVPFPLTGEEVILETILKAVSRRTRLAMIDHVTSHTALIFPLTRIVAELERRGIDTLVDGAHAPGMLPLNLAKIQPAYYAGNLHKWVGAPKGAGFLWARADKQRGLQPAVISHGNNTTRPGFTPFQDRFDWGGTFDPTAWFCVPDALEWMGTLLPGGWAELRQRNHKLVVASRRRICAALQVESPCPESLLGSMATIPLPARFQGRPKEGKIEREQRRLYDQFGIELPWVRLGPQGKRHVRISAQIYNTPAQYDYLTAALLKLK